MLINHRDKLIAPRTREQLTAARNAAVDKMEALLADGPKTASELFAPLEGIHQTHLGYLRYMHKTLRMIHMTGQRRDRFFLWTLGADPKLEALDDELDLPRRAGFAKQIVIRRDPLVAALFGPATQQL